MNDNGWINYDEAAEEVPLDVDAVLPPVAAFLRDDDDLQDALGNARPDGTIALHNLIDYGQVNNTGRGARTVRLNRPITLPGLRFFASSNFKTTFNRVPYVFRVLYNNNKIPFIVDFDLKVSTETMPTAALVPPVHQVLLDPNQPLGDSFRIALKAMQLGRRILERAPQRQTRHIQFVLTVAFEIDGRAENFFLLVPLREEEQDVLTDVLFTFHEKMYETLQGHLNNGQGSDIQEDAVLSFQFIGMRVINADVALQGREEEERQHARIPHPIRVLRGGCFNLRTYVNMKTARILQDLIVQCFDSADLPMKLVRHNCAIRCIIFALNGAKYSESNDYTLLCRDAIDFRDQAPFLSKDGPITVGDLFKIANFMKINIHLIYWKDRMCWVDLTQHTLPTPADRDFDDPHVYLGLIEGHYILFKNRECFEKASQLVYCAGRLDELGKESKKRCYHMASMDHWMKHNKDVEDPDAYFESKRRIEAKLPPKVSTAQKKFPELLALKNGYSFTTDLSKDLPEESLTPDNHILVCDLETFKSKGPLEVAFHEVYAAAIQDGLQQDAEYHSYWGPNAINQLCEHLRDLARDTDEKSPYYLYFYNGSGFDNFFVLNEFMSHFGAMPADFVLSGGKIMSFSLFGKCIIVRDLYLFLNCSLAQACKSFHVPDELTKGEFNHDLMTCWAAIEDYKDECLSYLRNDITALAFILDAFRKKVFSSLKLDLCKRITASQLAFDAWFKTLNEEARRSITLPRSLSDDFGMRQAYYGGRVFPQRAIWVLKDGLKSTYAGIKGDGLIDLDIASLYPTAMAGSAATSYKDKVTGEMILNVPPYYTGDYEYLDEKSVLLGNLIDAIAIFTRRCRLFSLNSFKEKYGGNIYLMYNKKSNCSLWPEQIFPLEIFGAQVFGEVTPRADIVTPLTPFKDAHGDLQWTIGTHKTSLVLEELLEAIIFGYSIANITGAYVFKKRIAMFEKHINDNFALKAACERGDIQRDLCKLLMNGVYGKFAQKHIPSTTIYVLASDLDEKLAKEDVLDLQPVFRKEFADKRTPVKIVRNLYDENNTPQMALNSRYTPTLDEHTPEMNCFVDQFMDVFEEDVDTETEVIAFKAEVASKSMKPKKPVYVAAQVTAHSRMIMNRMLFVLGALLDPYTAMFYTDTDSVVVFEAQYEKAKAQWPELFGKELGQLDDELEGGRIFEYYCIAPKFYCLAYKKPDNSNWLKIRTKGFPHTKNSLPYIADAELEAQDEEIRRLYCRGSCVRPDVFIPFKTYIYRLTYKDKEYFAYHLSAQWFLKMIDDSHLWQNNNPQWYCVTRLSVHYSTLKKRFSNDHEAEAFGIQHMNQSREIVPMSWWNSPECPRVKLNHWNNFTPTTAADRTVFF